MVSGTGDRPIIVNNCKGAVNIHVAFARCNAIGMWVRKVRPKQPDSGDANFDRLHVGDPGYVGVSASSVSLTFRRPFQNQVMLRLTP